MQLEHLMRLTTISAMLSDLAHDKTLDRPYNEPGGDILLMLRYHTANFADFCDNIFADEIVNHLDDDLRELLASDPDSPQ